MPTARVNGVSLYYEAEGAGRPLVLIHGHTLNLRMWDLQVPFFVRDHRVIRYDVRGHGRSESPAAGYDYLFHGADLAALLDYIGIEQAALVGFSMGGAIAIEFALLHPHRVTSLALVSAVVDGYRHSEEWKQFFRSFAEVMRKDGPLTAMAGLWLDHPMFAMLRRSPTKFYDFRDMVLTYSGGQYLAPPGPRVTRPWKQTERLAEIRVPTLVVSGEQDVPDIRGTAELLARDIPGAQARIIPEAGHMVTMERSGTFNALLREFLSRVGPGETQERSDD